MPGSAGDLTTRMSAGAAQVKIFHRGPVRESTGQHLVWDPVAVADLSVGEADSFLNVQGSLECPIDQAAPEIGRIFGNDVDNLVTHIVAYIVPGALFQVPGRVEHPVL